MSINCEVVLRWEATPEQNRALGAALWGWCNRTAGNAGIYPYLDNQPLADLLAGRFPVREPLAGDRPAASFFLGCGRSGSRS